MTRDATIVGMPYFPGVAVGRLQRGMDGATADHIVILRQDEIVAFATLPAGFIVVEAAPFSHTMIALLGYGVPTILISKQQADRLVTGVRLLIDGISGRITDDIAAYDVSPQALPSLHAGQPVLSTDGVAVSLCASVRHPTAAKHAVAMGAKGIGLVRSEFLTPGDNSIPDTAFYQSAFGDICEAATPLAVTFRLLDLAADKLPDWLPAPETADSALGLQGVRRYGSEPVRGVIKAQLAALNRLASRFNIRLLIPYLVRYEELNYWLAFVRQRLPSGLAVGAMAETPASALDISHWLVSADFIAIGCNDLMQCLYAADRDRPELQYYMDPYAPFLFRFFRHVAEQAGDNLHKVQLCGVLSQTQGVLPVLLGLGYRVFSVDAPFIPYLATIVAATSIADCETLAAEVCAAKETREVLESLRLATDRHMPFLT